MRHKTQHTNTKHTFHRRMADRFYVEVIFKVNVPKIRIILASVECFGLFEIIYPEPQSDIDRTHNCILWARVPRRVFGSRDVGLVGLHDGQTCETFLFYRSKSCFIRFVVDK